jgi:tetratricopeptide (TPR) repeat protein
MMTAEEASKVRIVVIDHLSHGRLAEGERVLAENSSALPEHILLECQGSVHFYRRQLQDAVRCYEAAIALAPEVVVARYQYLVGTQAEKAGDFVSAFERYQAAIGAEPTFVDAYVELGGLLTKVDDLEGALNCYRDALALEPHDPTNHYNVVAVLDRLVALGKSEHADELASARTKLELVPATDRGAGRQW